MFLDIAWIKQHIPNAAEHIKRKLPSMYHQFKQLAEIDITKEPMEVGPTTHYMMGGVRVDGDSQMSTVPGLFAAGEVAAGLHGANRLGGNSLSDLLVFGKRAGEYAAEFPRRTARMRPMRPDAEPVAEALEPFERGPAARIHIRFSTSCRNRCRHWWALCARKSEMQQALSIIDGLRERAATRRRRGTPCNTTTAGIPRWTCVIC